MFDLIRSSALTGYNALVISLGGNPGELLHGEKIDPRAIDRPDVPISFRSVVRVLEASATVLNCPDFGLRLAQQQDLRILGPVGIIGLNSPTVGAALKTMIEHLGFYSPLILTTIDRVGPRRVLLTYDIALKGELHRRQIIELAMRLYERHMQTLIGSTYLPAGVMLRHSSALPQSVYRAHFGVRVRLGQSQNALVVRPDDLNRPLRKIDPNLGDAEIQRQVAYFVRRLLPEGRCSLGAVAEHLYLHERTLQRRLSDIDVTFEEIVDRARRERAEELLAQSSLSMARIAEQLGYSEQSSFNRASKRWFRRAPGKIKVRR